MLPENLQPPRCHTVFRKQNRHHASAVLPPKGHLKISGNIHSCPTSRGEVLPAPSGWGLGCRARPPHQDGPYVSSIQPEMAAVPGLPALSNSGQLSWRKLSPFRRILNRTEQNCDLFSYSERRIDMYKEVTLTCACSPLLL